jgi:hypothetical protein
MDDATCKRSPSDLNLVDRMASPVTGIVDCSCRAKTKDFSFKTSPQYSTVRNKNTGFFYWAVKPQNDRLRFFEKSQTLNAGQFFAKISARDNVNS